MGSGAPDAFLHWVKFAAESPSLSRPPCSHLKRRPQSLPPMMPPFPTRDIFSGARVFPMLVPLLPHHAQDRTDNDKAWEVLEAWDKPVAHRVQ